MPQVPRLKEDVNVVCLAVDCAAHTAGVAHTLRRQQADGADDETDPAAGLQVRHDVTRRTVPRAAPQDAVREKRTKHDEIFERQAAVEAVTTEPAAGGGERRVDAVEEQTQAVANRNTALIAQLLIVREEVLILQYPHSCPCCDNQTVNDEMAEETVQKIVLRIRLKRKRNVFVRHILRVALGVVSDLG